MGSTEGGNDGPVGVSGPDDLLFPPTGSANGPSERSSDAVPAVAPWTVLVVDDDPDVHAITRYVLSDLRFDNRPIVFESAYSAAQAQEILNRSRDVAVILLDVIMESDEAGLALVHHVRNTLGNNAVRILLRTGQPNMFPEREIALEHDVNDYLSKNQTTADRLFTATVTALRGYQQIREREETERRLVQAEKLEALGGLAGGIAHDFNNVLATVIGAAEIARDELEPGHAASFYLRTILNAGRRGRDIVRQILTFSRPSQLSMRPVALTDLVRDTLDLVRQGLPSGVLVITDLAPDDSWIAADSGQIHQILTNLCINAGQAMPDGGRLTVTLKTEAAPPDGRKAVLEIADTGTGIPVEHRNRIFEPFFTTKRSEKGTGLGLAVVHGIVRAHNADISVTSTTAAEGPSTGTCFRIAFPVVERPAGAAREALLDAPLPRGKGEPILVVEDEPELLVVVRSVLGSLGYDPECFESPLEALREYRARPSHFRLVLTDYSMPGMTGTELAEEVAGTDPRIPVVLMSGDLQRDVDDRFAAILEKPLFRDELALVLDELLA